MDQRERLLFLIDMLRREKGEKRAAALPDSEDGLRRLLRGLMNVREAAPLPEGFEKVQDAYLQERNRERGIVRLEDIPEVRPGIRIWQGDITRLAVDAVVNAANSRMTGCYRPCHSCIDNCIHTYAGVQLRNFCAAMMDRQGFPEPTGRAKATPAFNLPCRHVIHTVGPIVRDGLSARHEADLASCYRSCLEAAETAGDSSIAFCCISTGVFMFPNRRAAEIAVGSVADYRARTGGRINVVFNVWKDLDLEIYRELLCG